MSKSKSSQVKPRLYRGFRDIFAPDLRMRNRVIERVREVYERYGYVPLETPAVEYVDVLGKYLPESDEVAGGIFSFRNEDDEWVALRYDMTAPLSRIFAQYPELPRPFRRYTVGPVWRFEKPGPGRFREFYQFDFDIVGTAGVAADTEVCCVMCEVLEAIGVQRGDYLVKVNNRKVLNGVLEAMDLLDFSRVLDVDEDPYLGYEGGKKRVTYLDVLRTVDKLDKIGLEGVRELLTTGRQDRSGDFTPGLELSDQVVERIAKFLGTRAERREEVCDKLAEIVAGSEIGAEGVNELREIDRQLRAVGFDEDRVVFDPSVVRGLGYYTGPVYEGVLTLRIRDEKNRERAFGSVFGGGRYDDLVRRFTGQKVPATGASIGVDRLIAALKMIRQKEERKSTAQVLVTVMDREKIGEYMKIARQLRDAGLNTELFLGKGNIGKQLKYADKCDIPIAVIAGEDEFRNDTVQVKDLWLGRELAEEVLDREEWRSERPAQFQVPRQRLVEEVGSLVKKYNLVR